MNISSILVVTTQPYFDSTIASLSDIDGVQVHYCDEKTSRIVVTQEAENTDTEVEGLKRIKSLPHVVLAEMVYHYCEDPEGEAREHYTA